MNVTSMEEAGYLIALSAYKTSLENRIFISTLIEILHTKCNVPLNEISEAIAANKAKDNEITEELKEVEEKLEEELKNIEKMSTMTNDFVNIFEQFKQPKQGEER